ncbi:MAG: EAL domain-containing protein [Betaproteobacteria bacterium]|nr:MAG: EAL domain-containing protein [Betaproteobacteria bacterium]
MNMRRSPPDKLALHEYSIQQTAERLGLAVHTLRRWHENGILVARRTEGGHRRYPRELIDTLAAAGMASYSGSADSEELAAVKRSLEDKRRVIQLLLESEKRYRDLVETSHDLIWTTDAQGRFTYVNKASVEVFGLEPGEIIGRCFFDFEVRPAHIANRRFLSKLRRQGEVRNYLTHLRTAQGQDRWIGINARLSASEAGTITGIRGTARDVTETQLAMMEMERMAARDHLTGLPNRTALQQTLEQLLRTEQHGAVIFLDLDHFRYVNEGFGYTAGDQLLIGIASALRETMESSGAKIYRLGGDEFAIVVKDRLRAHAAELTEIALEAVRQYRCTLRAGHRMWSVSASAGVALFPFHANDVPGLLANVDAAMFEAKEAGRNRYVLFGNDPEDRRSTQRRMHWSRKLRDAIDADRIVLHCQPVVRLTDRKTMHYEVLARLRDDDGSLIQPAQFIELAESLGLIREIDLRVVEKVLRHIAAHPARASLRYFVNLSRVSISDPAWVSRFQQLLSASPVPPGQLVFEITETAAMSEVDVTLKFIERLKQMGHRFALDDFGAGFSSFFYLKRFEVDYIKIDGGFIRDLCEGNSNVVFVQALIDVARGLSKQVIAEGVETPQALEILLQMGAQYGQGYLFRSPYPLEDGPDAAPLVRPAVA